VSYQNSLETLNYFEKEGLQSAQIISETANKQFINGEINYLDFVMLFNQSISIQNNYIEALKGLNDAAIQLQYLTLK
jgi:cobalt-zinc-cadmium resistance protein CzcA